MDTFDDPGALGERGDSRAQFTDDVPREVKRFIWCTSPHKCWAEYLAGNWYRSMQITRKYDGWFLVVYVDKDKKVRWQTTSGFIHSVLAKEVAPLIAHMEKLVSEDKLKSTHAFKLEIVISNANDENFLHLMGKKFNPEEYSYKLMVTDCFVPYSDSMIRDLNLRLQWQHNEARKHKTAPLSAQEWLNSFFTKQGGIEERLKTARTLLAGAGIPNLEIAPCKNVGRDKRNISGQWMVLEMSKALIKNAYEGFVLHSTDKKGHSIIYKIKLEYMGGLGSYYSPTLDEEIRQWDNEKPLYAGRQFVVRCVTVECFHDTHIPMNIGVGYYDEDLCAWVVCDCIKVKYSGGTRVGRYIDTSVKVDGKHIGVTRQTQLMANMIAKILDIANPTPDKSNLHLTSHFKKESTGNLLNVAELGLIVGGNANHVYKSENGNYHLQAAVLKCIGMCASSHAFTEAEIDDVRAFATHAPVIHSAKEWSKGDWENMTNLGEQFNKSSVLSGDHENCMLWQRLEAIRATPHVPRPFVTKLQNLSGIRCCQYGGIDKIGAIVRHIHGKCIRFETIENVINNTSGIEDQIDIVFIPAKNAEFNTKLFDIITKQIQIPFLTVRESWALKCEKDHFQMPDIANYSVEYGPLLPDETFIKDEQRFLWKRARDRLAASAQAVPAAQVAPAAPAAQAVPAAQVAPAAPAAQAEPAQVAPAAPAAQAEPAAPAAQAEPAQAAPAAQAEPEQPDEPDVDQSEPEEVRVRPATPPQIPLHVRRPLQRMNFSFQKCNASSRTLRFFENLIFDLGGSTFDFGGIGVLFQYPEEMTHTSPSFIHAMYFYVLKRIRDKFNEMVLDEESPALDYQQGLWKHFFVFKWDSENKLFKSTEMHVVETHETIIQDDHAMKAHVNNCAGYVLNQIFKFDVGLMYGSSWLPPDSPALPGGD